MVMFADVERFYLRRIRPFIHLGRFKGTSDDYFKQRSGIRLHLHRRAHNAGRFFATP
jgi:hypothetical protein